MPSKIALTIFAVIILIVIPIERASGFPIGISIHGGLGKGYYSMQELNDNLNELRL